MSPRASTTIAEKAGLSREAIVERALAIADEEGSDAITIRRVAQEFGVTPMALYWHIANKEELLAAMGDALLDSVEAPMGEGPWNAQLRGVVESLVAALARHPAAAGLVFPRVLACDSGRRLAEFTLALLQRAGFTVQQSADLARMAMQTAMMLVTQHPNQETQAARNEWEAIHAEKRRSLLSLPSDVYPHIVDAVGPLLDCDDDEAYYGFGIDLYLEGAEALLRRHKRAARR